MGEGRVGWQWEAEKKQRKVEDIETLIKMPMEDIQTENWSGNNAKEISKNCYNIVYKQYRCKQTVTVIT